MSAWRSVEVWRQRPIVLVRSIRPGELDVWYQALGALAIMFAGMLADVLPHRILGLLVVWPAILAGGVFILIGRGIEQH